MFLGRWRFESRSKTRRIGIRLLDRSDDFRVELLAISAASRYDKEGDDTNRIRRQREGWHDGFPPISRRSLLKTIVYGGGSLVLVGTGGYFLFKRPRIADALARELVDEIEGAVLRDTSQLSAYRRDFGGWLDKSPRIVVRPATLTDVQATLRAAQRHQVPVHIRGRAYSGAGQALCDGGIVLHTHLPEATIEMEGADVWAPGGMTLRALLRQLRAKKRRLPVAPTRLGMTIGGLLSVGGFGMASIEQGMLADHVRELELIGSSGELLRCSQETHPELFLFSLGGLGQLGIVHRVRLATLPDRPTAKLVTARLAEPYAAIRLLEHAMRDDLQGRISFFHAALSYRHTLVRLGRCFTTTQEAKEFNVEPLLPESNMLAQVEILDAERLSFDDSGEEALHGDGKGYSLWMDLLFQDRRYERYFNNVIARVQQMPEDVQPRAIQLLPIRRMTGRRLPNGPQFGEGQRYGVCFSLGYVLPKSDREKIDPILRQMQNLQDLALIMGARPYRAGWFSLRRDQKLVAFGADYLALEKLKAKLDPQRLLNPGLWLDPETA